MDDLIFIDHFFIIFKRLVSTYKNCEFKFSNSTFEKNRQLLSIKYITKQFSVKMIKITVNQIYRTILIKTCHADIQLGFTQRLSPSSRGWLSGKS